ncbi:MAG: succinyl-diaminopimelate desuccinylase [Deltaproteobacteria bacterium]|nr:succinyl-diaminopimelate desuccinylase [Deltaproteobacteria bacterium]
MAELQKRLAERTLELCRIPSVTGGEKAIADHLETWCRASFGRDVRRIGNSLVAGDLGDSRPTVLLVGHVDTVPGQPGDPLPHLEDDRVVGLGASDMKGGDAVMMALAEDLPRTGLACNLALVFYEAEEGPFEGNGLGPVLASLPELKRARLAFCLESTDCEVQVGCVGSLQAKVTFRGRSAHSARPWQGDNAIHKAAPLLAELSTRERRRVEVEGFEFFEVVSATLARGGRAANVVPEAFELNLNYRFAPGQSVAQAERELRELVAGRAEVEIVDRSPAGRVCAANPLLQRFREIGGVEASSKQAWTDVARLGEAGIDAVNYGPGLTSQAHQAGEFCPIANLERAYRALRGFLEA